MSTEWYLSERAMPQLKMVISILEGLAKQVEGAEVFESDASYLDDAVVGLVRVRVVEADHTVGNIGISFLHANGRIEAHFANLTSTGGLGYTRLLALWAPIVALYPSTTKRA